MTEETLQQARKRWHSDDPIVCLRRALAEVALFESIEKARKEGTSPDPTDRGLRFLERIADAIEQIANQGIPTAAELTQRRVQDAQSKGYHRVGRAREIPILEAKELQPGDDAANDTDEI